MATAVPMASREVDRAASAAARNGSWVVSLNHTPSSPNSSAACTRSGTSRRFSYTIWASTFTASLPAHVGRKGISSMRLHFSSFHSAARASLRRRTYRRREQGELGRGGIGRSLQGNGRWWTHVEVGNESPRSRPPGGDDLGDAGGSRCWSD